MKSNGTYLLSCYENSGGACFATVNLRLRTAARRLSLRRNPHAVVVQNCGPAPVSAFHDVAPVLTNLILVWR